MRNEEYSMVKPVEEIVDEFRKAYNRNPSGWHILIGYDKRRRLNIYIGQRDVDSVWIILAEPHFGLGKKINDVNISELVEGKISFGLRTIPNNLAKRMRNELLEYHRISEKTRKMVKECMLRNKPLREKEISDNWVVQGPVITMSPEYSIDERIRSKFLFNTIEELSKRFEKEVVKRYRYLG